MIPVGSDDPFAGTWFGTLAGPEVTLRDGQGFFTTTFVPRRRLAGKPVFVLMVSALPQSF